MAKLNRTDAVEFHSQTPDIAVLALAFKNGVENARVRALDLVLARVSFTEPEHDSGPFARFADAGPDFEVVAVITRGAAEARLLLEIHSLDDRLSGRLTRQWHKGLNGDTSKLSVAVLTAALAHMHEADPTMAVVTGGSAVAPPTEVGYDISNWSAPELMAITTMLGREAIEWATDGDDLVIEARHESRVDEIVRDVTGAELDVDVRPRNRE